MKINEFKKVIAMALGFLIVLSLFTVILNLGISVALGQEHVQTAQAATDPKIAQAAFLAAAIAVGLGSVGAGIAVGSVGSAAMGVMAERPEMASRALIFVGLAEGIAIYGLIISIMILGRI